MTNAIANTMPVRAIVPEAAADRYTCAEATDRPNVQDAKYACSMRGSVNP